MIYFEVLAKRLHFASSYLSIKWSDPTTHYSIIFTGVVLFLSQKTCVPINSEQRKYATMI